jgi:hypothetical protein
MLQARLLSLTHGAILPVRQNELILLGYRTLPTVTMSPVVTVFRNLPSGAAKNAD